MDETNEGQPVSDVLVIGVTKEEAVRGSLETKFVKAFEAEEPRPYRVRMLSGSVGIGNWERKRS